MKKVVLQVYLVIALLASLSACTQKYGIYRSEAYYRQSPRGTQMVNDAGQPVGSPLIRENLIYIETNSKTVPVITSAWIDGKPYIVQLVKAQPSSNIGTAKEGGRTVAPTPAEGRQMWQLQLTENPDGKANAATAEAIKNNAVVLMGNWKNKPFTYTVKTQEQLEGLMYQ